MTIKKVIQFLFRNLGFKITKYIPEVQNNGVQKSIRTKSLSFYKTQTGNYYSPTDAVNDIVANTIKNNQIFDENIVNVAKKYIIPDTVVLDIGANFGQMSILFANMIGEKGKVYSFDADDWVFEILNKNVEANNKQDKIITHFGAVHNIEGAILNFPEQDFERFETYGSYGIDYANKKEGRKVPSITIDSLNITEPISFIKIDIQGGDLQAMQGAVRTIERNKMPILFEYEYLFEEDCDLCFQDYVNFVQSINYKFHKVINGQNYLIIPKD